MIVSHEETSFVDDRGEQSQQLIHNGHTNITGHFFGVLLQQQVCHVVRDPNKIHCETPPEVDVQHEIEEEHRGEENEHFW